MISRIRKAGKGKFFRNVAIVATGTAAAQVITMISAPITARLYGPEAFGLLGSFVALLAILTPIAALTYPIAIVLPKKEDEARGIARLSIFLSLIMSLVALLVTWSVGEQVAALLGAETMSAFLWFIPFAMLFSGLHQVMEQWLIRQQLYKFTAKVVVLHSAILNSAKVGIGVYQSSALVLIVLQTLTTGLHAFLLWMGVRNSKDKEGSDKDTSETFSIKKIAVRYKDFPIFRAPEMTINAASQGLPVLMLAALFGPASAGFYTLGRTVMGIPASLIGKSVGDVFYPRISEAANNEEALYPLVFKATMLMAVVGVLPFAIVMAIGPLLFEFVFGAEWIIAGEYARWLALWMFFMFINNPAVKAIPVVKAQKFQLYYTVLALLVRVIALFLAFSIFKSDLVTVAIFGIVGAVVNVVLVIIVMAKCKAYDAMKAIHD